MRKSRLILIAVAVALIAGGVAVWQLYSPVGNLAGTATTPCAPTSTHWCAPSYIKNSPGEAHWTNTKAIKFENRNNDGNKNQIKWWASHGKYTSSTFFFNVDTNASKTLEFPCAIDHVFADNKGPANTVFTNTVDLPDIPRVVDPIVQDGYESFVAVGETVEMIAGHHTFEDVRVLKIKNKDPEEDAYINWAWQKVPNEYQTLKMFEIWGMDDIPPWDGGLAHQYSNMNQIDINPLGTATIVLPCNANIGIENNAKRSAAFVDWLKNCDVNATAYPRWEDDGRCHSLANLTITRVA